MAAGEIEWGSRYVLLSHWTYAFVNNARLLISCIHFSLASPPRRFAQHGALPCVAARTRCLMLHSRLWNITVAPS